jgi:hypothetical protein
LVVNAFYHELIYGSLSARLNISMSQGRQYLVSTARSLKLDLKVPYEEMIDEAKKLRKFFQEYREDGSGYNGWHTLTLHGLGEDKGYSWQDYGYATANDASKDMYWTKWSALCPITTTWLKMVFPSKTFGRVRFMLLEAGGSIDLHKDTDHSILEMVNIALNHPKGCEWRWEDGSVLEFQPGDAICVNISYPHMVVNNSNEDRYHLIVHHHDSTEEWVNMMKRALDANGETGDFHYSEMLY